MISCKAWGPAGAGAGEPSGAAPAQAELTPVIPLRLPVPATGFPGAGLEVAGSGCVAGQGVGTVRSEGPLKVLGPRGLSPYYLLALLRVIQASLKVPSSERLPLASWPQVAA